jgi:hypothetical protein
MERLVDRKASIQCMRRLRSLAREIVSVLELDPPPHPSEVFAHCENPLNHERLPLGVGSFDNEPSFLTALGEISPAIEFTPLGDLAGMGQSSEDRARVSHTEWRFHGGLPQRDAQIQ